MQRAQANPGRSRATLAMPGSAGKKKYREAVIVDDLAVFSCAKPSPG